MGVVGFGPDQELNVLEKYGLKFKPDIVIQGICSINDSGDIYMDQLYTTGANNELVATRANPVRTMVFPSFFSIVNAINFIKHKDDLVHTLDPLLFGDPFDLSWTKYMDSDEAKYKVSLMKAIFEKTKQVTASRNITYIAVIIPSYNAICDDSFFKDNNVPPERYFTNEEVYQALLTSENIPFINLAPVFMHLTDKNQRCALYDPSNAHLSPLGNLYTAKIIAYYLTGHGLSDK